MSEITSFYTLSHILISLIGATLLFIIYYNIRKRFQKLLEEESQKRIDKGLFFLGCALLAWVASGAWAFISDSLGFYINTTGKATYTYMVGLRLLSIVNNLFFLLALFYFNHAPSFIYKNEKNVRSIFIIITAVTLATIALSWGADNSPNTLINYFAIPDFLLSAFLTYLLAVSLYKTFANRGFNTVALIAVFILLMMQCSQVPDVFLSLDDQFFSALIKLVAKTSLIFLFLVLATSWVIQLANTPKITEMQLRMTEWAVVQLTIPSKEMNAVVIDFGSKTTQYKNLLKFAIRKKYGTAAEQSIVVGATGELKNQTYLSRIIDNINSILQSEDDQKLERKDLFTFLGEGRYRLRILAEHIHIHPQLQQDFIKSLDDDAYDRLDKKD